jgi:hypothetical protein
MVVAGHAPAKSHRENAMRNTSMARVGLAATLAIASPPAPALAQVPYIQGTWRFNPTASHLPGPPPQSQVRSYRLGPDGVLQGVAVTIAPNGTPSFLIFAAKPDGQDHPEFDTQTAARYLADGSPPPRTYAETPTQDDHRVKWVDKGGGRILQSGEKWVSPDGKTMSFTVDGSDQLCVFDRTGP